MITVKRIVSLSVLVVAFLGSIVIVHRSFRGGYPESAQRAGAKVRTEARAKMRAEKLACPGVPNLHRVDAKLY